MKHLILKDKNFRLVIKNVEVKKRCLMFLFHRIFLSCTFRQVVYFKLKNLTHGSTSFFVNRCVLTGRSRAVFRDFKMSRIILRAYISNGQVLGCKKSSW